MHSITTTERGWPGHYLLADKCLFRRNTLITSIDMEKRIDIVVSTVGRLMDYSNYKKVIPIDGSERYFETLAFHVTAGDTKFCDADVSREISFYSPWAIYKEDAEIEADIMHDTVVKEIIEKLN